MITFLASPKPFKGIMKEHQYQAIRSWQAAAEDAEVILYGDSAGIDEAGDDLGVCVQKQIGCALSGVPYFGSIADHAAEHGRHDLQVYLNCDILLWGIAPALRRIEFSQFLLIGQRIDLGAGLFIDVGQSDWQSELRRLIEEGRASLSPPSGVDYFGFRRGLWNELPSVVIGRAGYDNALLAYCLRRRIPLVDATFSVVALHQYHDYGQVQGGHQEVWQGHDAQNNYRHAGGPHSRTMVSDANYVLQGSVVQPWPCRGDRLRRLELKLRYEAGWLKSALVLRVIWRGLRALGITRVPQPSQSEVIKALCLPGNNTVKAVK